MKLTNYHRNAFIAAVLQDVPKVDHQELARVELQKKAVELLPPKLRAMHKEFGHWFKTDTIWSLPGDIQTVRVVSIDDNDTLAAMKADADFWQRIEKIAADMNSQKIMRDNLRDKLRGAIYSCTTVKQAHELLPEFSKYLPSDDPAKDRSLPVVANLVADLTAAGWPKDKTKAKRKAA